ncbi:hypothetical protein BN14_07582 [Rhizoctonia solani AG-1 IB]|uniref:Leucine zipper with capping helix domain-containing protein n=1 Tax=Thanatephorus cucumeris (strain AG1-IB / isolate 7/3/14) TaxID=1108050 RepID=M5C0M4_THACB|nr:hypothetical protein BN14_07582 [Rhizoctonia solani AG-1 IB]
MDKIGSSNLLEGQWYDLKFPCTSTPLICMQLASSLASSKEDLASLESKMSSLAHEVESETTQREDTEDRIFSLAQLAQNRANISELESEMAQYGLADPVVLERKRRAVVLAREAACRWTDNYSVLFSHITRALGCDANELREYLSIGEGYEDIE